MLTSFGTLRTSYRTCTGFSNVCKKQILSRPWDSEIRKKYCSTCYQLYCEDEADRFVERINESDTEFYPPEIHSNEDVV